MKHAAALLLTLSLACALPVASQAPKPADPRVAIAKQIPGTSVEDLRATPLEGIYELVRGGDIAYVSSDGRYAIAGDLYDLAGNDNLTETRRRGLRLALVAEVPADQVIEFAPKSYKHTMTVFTDVDCGYCRKLHAEIDEYNRLGIRVRYLFYPRSGPGTESWATAEKVWCSPDRKQALTRAKRGETITAAKCNPTPVRAQYELGGELGIGGTPAIVLDSGEMLPGYVPPAMLAEHLKTSAAAVAPAR